MMPYYPSLRRRSLGKLRRLINLQGSSNAREKRNKEGDFGNEEDGPKQMLGMLLHWCRGTTRVKGGTSAPHKELTQATFCQWEVFHHTYLPGGILVWAASPYRILSVI